MAKYTRHAELKISNLHDSNQAAGNSSVQSAVISIQQREYSQRERHIGRSELSRVVATCLLHMEDVELQARQKRREERHVPRHEPKQHADTLEIELIRLAWKKRSHHNDLSERESNKQQVNMVEAGSSSESDVWQLSVAHGKQTLVVAFQPQHPQRVTLLKLEVEKQTGVAAKYQRLIYRGKELLADAGDSPDLVKNKKKRSSPPPLMNNAKLMLLLNQAYHQEVAKRSASPAKPADIDNQASSSSTEAPATPAAANKQIAIDVDSLDDDEVLVQAFRGKANYELILKRDDVVMVVKERVSGMLGLAPQGVRLVVKGKTPKDDTNLSELLGSGARMIKCMVLLQAQQHVVLEKEDDLRQLLNELTQLQVEAKRLEKQVTRNFASREETTIRVSALVDGAQCVHSNLELLLDHLLPRGGGALTKPRANQQTTDLLTKAIQDSQTLCEVCQALLQRLTLL